MIWFPNLLALAGAMLLVAMLPGPDFIAVSSRALSGRREGVAVALGVACGCATWATLAAFGLGAVVARLGGVYEAIRLLGAAYLAWLGLKMLLAARHAAPAPAAHVANIAAPPAAIAGSRRGESRWGGFQRGLLVNLSNPKAVVFFGSLFVTILPAGAPLWADFTSVAVVAAVAAGWFVTLALMFSVTRVRAAYLRLRRPIDALTGVVLIGLGARLAVLE